MNLYLSVLCLKPIHIASVWYAKTFGKRLSVNLYMSLFIVHGFLLGRPHVLYICSSNYKLNIKNNLVNLDADLFLSNTNFSTFLEHLLLSCCQNGV